MCLVQMEVTSLSHESLFFLNIYFELFIYLAVPSLAHSMWDL